MAHETPTVQARTRDRVGSRYAKRLRQGGRLPAIIYGHKIDPVAISVDEREILGLLHDGNHLFSIQIEGANQPETCLVRDLQFGYLGDNVVHLDFTRVDLDEEVTVHVHIRYVGEPEAAKEPGAVLNHDLTELEIVCKAGAIPDEIVVDLSNLEDSLLVSEIALPEGVRTELPEDTVLSHISYVEEEAEGEEITVAGEAEPELITEHKEDEDEAEDEEES